MFRTECSIRGDYMNDYYFERVENSRYARIHRSDKKRFLKFQKSILMLIIFFIMIIISILSIKHFTFAEDNNINVRKQYKSIMIYCGDSVDEISDNFVLYGYPSKDSLSKEICSINGLSFDCELTPGNYIIVPYYEEIY